MNQCEVCDGHLQQIHATHYACDTCELNILDGVYVVENENGMGYHQVQVIDRKIFDSEKIGVLKEDIISFLDKWLVDSGSLKFHANTISFIKKLTPFFSYQGTMVRGLFSPFVQIKRNGVDECIESWSKSTNGIHQFEQFANFSFGKIVKEDGCIVPFTPQEFIDKNANVLPAKVDKVLMGNYAGLDLYLLARYVEYRKDFLEKLKVVEEVLVIQKTS
ncbi:hypothetical protein ACFVS2_25270 [Brevibacillus sp. NPDC058079]|uniref:hypothetical protein n=1 Tax=Brevibacillus sp. NPDC058079 TaxID=3346330 RepID=UPI0036F1475E